jgi:lipopolysaccharide export system protein LptA
MTVALLLALALAAPPARATEAVSRRAPVRVDADEVQYAFQKHQVVFSGKRPVVLTRDDATLTCRKIVALTDDAGQIVTATCTGDVRLARGTRLVTCDHATFHESDEQVICEGNPVLKDGGSEAKGSRLVYDLRADEVKLEEAKITLPGVEIEERRRTGEDKRKVGGGKPESDATAAERAKPTGEAAP